MLNVYKFLPIEPYFFFYKNTTHLNIVPKMTFFFLSMRTSSRWLKFFTTAAHVSAEIFWITLRIEIFSSSTESGYGLYINTLGCPNKKKSKGLWSGEWGRQTFAVLEETKFPSNVMQPIGNISGGVGSRHLVETRYPLA